MSAPEFSNPSTVAAPLGAYSHTGWVRSGSDVLYIAGQVGVRPDGTLPESFAEQADEAFANIVRLLSAHGLKPFHLVKTNLYVVYGQAANVVREARRKNLGDVRPASTFIYVPQLVEPKYLIEIEGVAVR
ncbi:MAG: RidA family protein [Alphaproteobacteria bacterium]|nr:RidA family protein [Alphaproteobacteria bacterium]